jgi:glycine cleavage system H protein
MAHFPTDRVYTEEHEWAQSTPEGRYLVGITDFAARRIGRIVDVKLPTIGDTLEAGAPCASLESDDAVSEVAVPLAGTITAVNTELSAAPDLVNDEPYDSGWLIELVPTAPPDTTPLLTAPEYRSHLHARPI